MSEADDDNSDATEMVSPSDDEELGDIATKPWVWISTHFSLRPRRPRRAPAPVVATPAPEEPAAPQAAASSGLSRPN